MTKRKLWIEEYRGCGCSIGPIPKNELIGYCAIHGSDMVNRFALPQEATMKGYRILVDPDGEPYNFLIHAELDPKLVIAPFAVIPAIQMTSVITSKTSLLLAFPNWITSQSLTRML